MQGPPRFSFRLWLGALILVALVPAAAVVGFTVWKSGQTLRDNSLRLLEGSSSVVAHAVAGELINQATRVRMSAAAGTDENISFLRPSEGALDAVNLPAPLPQDVIEQVRKTGKPAVTNMLMGDNPSDPKVALILPGTPGRPEALAVSLVSPTELIKNLRIRDQKLGHFLIAVTDGNGYLIARSRNPERFVGKRVPDWDDLQALGTSHGVFEARTAEGGQVVMAFHTIANTPGWIVAIGEPLEAFDARWQRPLSIAIMASLVALAMAGVAAAYIARQILRPVHALADHARRVVTDANYTGRPARAMSAISEFEVLRRSLIRAEAALRRRARAERKASEQLAHSERRYRALATIGALVFWQSDLAGSLRSATGWSELTGDPERAALGSGWLDRIHPEDRASVEEACARALETKGELDVEFRLRLADDNWHWVRARGAPIPDDQGVVSEWVGVLEDIHERRQAQARIAHMALHDALTGLANRALFGERLQDAIAACSDEAQRALLCLDLDLFKEVNDTHGHPIGDALLKAVAERLLANVRASDTVARLGGDEFAIIQTSADSQPEAATELAERLVQALSTPFEVQGLRLVIGTSIGIALIDARSRSAEQLMRQADLALYRAKQAGRGQFCLLEPSTEAGTPERRRETRRPPVSVGG